MSSANWAVVLAYNNLHLTQAAIASLRKQDIEGGVSILVINNASQDGTGAWLNSQRDLVTLRITMQDSVAGCWNRALRWLFINGSEDYALVINNDACLRPDAYRWLVADGGLFVTCVGTRDANKIKPISNHVIGTIDGGTYRSGDTVYVNDLSKVEPFYPPPDPAAKRPHPDFSCYLIRRECFEKVGEFDEGFKRAFCEDGDMHVRLHKAGIKAECLELPFYHYGSATVKHCDPKERLAIQRQADLNRKYFAEKWGFEMASPQYYAYFGTGAPPLEST
jgi:GT2 family glycosyltransferase